MSAFAWLFRVYDPPVAERYPALLGVEGREDLKYRESWTCRSDDFLRPR